MYPYNFGVFLCLIFYFLFQLVVLALQLFAKLSFLVEHERQGLVLLLLSRQLAIALHVGTSEDMGTARRSRALALGVVIVVFVITVHSVARDPEIPS